MKFIESSSFLVRTVLYDFICRDKKIKLKFRLVPMIHIASEEYYENVLENLKDCDEVFYEGIDLIDDAEPITNRISLKNLNLTFKQYKMFANQLGLVTQSEHFDLRELDAELTHTDYDPESGSEAWGEVSLKEKLKMSFLDPLMMFIARQGMSRKKLAKQFMDSTEEMLLAYGPLDDEEGSSRNFTMNQRDQIVFQHIRESIESEGHSEKTIAIVYGAGHMKSMARFLIDEYHYFPTNGQFVTAFDIN